MSVGRTSLLLLPLAVVSRGVAFLIPIAMARLYGAAAEMDAWYWALSFPVFALVLASGAMGTAAMPAVAAARLRGPDRLGALLTALGLGGACALVAGGALLAALSPGLLPRITTFEPNIQRLTTSFLWSFLPFLGLVPVGTALRIANEQAGRFGLVAATPLLRAAVVLGALAAGQGRLLAPTVLPLSLAAGELAQIAVWAWPLWRDGVRPARPAGAAAELGLALRGLGPVLGGEGMIALGFVLDKAAAANFSPGAVSVVEYAERARAIPQTLFESSLLMVGFATWARSQAAGARDEAEDGLRAAVGWTLALASPVVAGLSLGRTLGVQVLYERGAFTAQDTAQTAVILGGYLVGLVPGLLGVLAMRGLVVQGRVARVLALGALGAAVNLALDGIGVQLGFGTISLALGTSAGQLVMATLGLMSLGVHRGGRGIGASLGLAAGSAVFAVSLEALGGAITSWTDPRLGVGVLGCVALLLAGARISRRPRPHHA